VNVHLAYGYTDMRKGMDGLALLVQTEFGFVRLLIARFPGLFCGFEAPLS